MKRLCTLLLFIASVSSAQTVIPPIVIVGQGEAPAAAPSFSPQAGTYAGAQTITMNSSTPGFSTSGTITYCTISSGTCTPSTVGSNVTLTTTSNICAFATVPNYLPSPTSCANYVITPIPGILQTNSSAANCGVTCTITLPGHAASGYTCVGDVVNESTPPTAISNTAGFTWSSWHTQTNSINWTAGWSCAPTLAFGSTDTVTVTNPTGTNHAALVIVDVGQLTNNTVDLFQGATGTSSAASTGSMTLSGDDMVLFIARTNSTATPSAGTCITCSGAGNWGAGSFQLAAYLETSASSLTVGTTNTSTSWAIEAVALH